MINLSLNKTNKKLDTLINLITIFIKKDD